MSFTGFFDLDSIILNKLNDRDLASICQINKAASYICNDDRYWLNRTLFFFGRYLGGPENIRNNYLKGRTWKEYYIYLTQNKDANQMGLENEDLVLLKLADVWSVKKARRAKTHHSYIFIDSSRKGRDFLYQLIKRRDNTVYVPALRVTGNRDLINLYFTKIHNISEDTIDKYLDESYSLDNYQTTMKNRYDEEVKAHKEFLRNRRIQVKRDQN